MERAPSRVEQTLKVREWIATGRARRLRQAAGMSQADAARDCEVDQASVMRWERGDVTPRGRNVGAYYRLLAHLEAAVGTTVQIG